MILPVTSLLKLTEDMIYRLTLFLLSGLLLAGCQTEVLIQMIPKRTVLVYMAADNSLSAYSYANLADILKGAAGNHLNGGNLLVYQDSDTALPQLIQITEGKDGTIEKQIVQTYEEQNSASVDVMRTVLHEVFQSGKYQADSYGLILWSHGTAWLPSDLRNYLRAYGQDKNDWMEINELRDALQGYTFDFIIFDDCYMANIEVAYALKDHTGYILASPTEVIAEGLPYASIVRHLFSTEPETVALTRIAESFFNYYNEQQGFYQSATIALVSTQVLPELAAATRGLLYGKEEDILNFPVSQVHLLEHLGYPNHALYDFGDFIRQFTAGDPALTEAYGRFQDCLNHAVVYKATTDRAYYANEGSFAIDRERFCGITVYIPQKQLSALNGWYKQLDWHKAVFE
jgi:hypothetical protein